jgi:Phytanoyl-CoA dioxygenase (PhyH)
VLPKPCETPDHDDQHEQLLIAGGMNHAGVRSSSGSGSSSNGNESEDDEDDGHGGDKSRSSRNSSSSSGSGGSGGRLTLEDGLSSETLQALLAFRLGDVRASAAATQGRDDRRGGQGADESGDDDEDDNDEAADGLTAGPSSSKSKAAAICVAYTAKDSLVIAQTLKRLQEKAERDHQRSMRDVIMPPMRDIPSLLDPTTTAATSARTRTPTETSNDSDDLLLQQPDDTKVQQYLEALQRDGVVRIDRVLALDTCDTCLALVNRALDDDGGAEASTVKEAAAAAKQRTVAAAATTTQPSIDNASHNGGHVEPASSAAAAAAAASNPVASYGYGNVFSRKNRYDMYLHPSNGVYAGALRELLHHRDSALGRLLQRLLVERVYTAQDSDDATPLRHRDGKDDCYFHEFSCLVSDPGSGHQPLHPDYTGLPPLFTVFVALQNVSTRMGPTVLVPTSHLFRNAGELLQSIDLSDASSYRQACIQRGDCIVMDSRTYHMGAGNTSSSESTAAGGPDGAAADDDDDDDDDDDGSGACAGGGQRRALLYLTLRDPDHATEDKDFPPNGSLFNYLKGDMKLSDYDGSHSSDVTPAALETASA